MSRGRRAAEPRSTSSPESPDLAPAEPKWSALTDTGSLQPSAEALDWQRRADAWAQQAESEESGAVEPASRWSEVAATGRPTFPADGVGWRTETAEWRATGARWRQTMEWRSTTGSHGWRSTTEAWQTDGHRTYGTPAETPMAQPSIASTAWQTPEDEAGTPADDGPPAWQHVAGSAPAAAWQNEQRPSETWQREQQASRQQPGGWQGEQQPSRHQTDGWQAEQQATRHQTGGWQAEQRPSRHQTDGWQAEQQATRHQTDGWQAEQQADTWQSEQASRQQPDTWQQESAASRQQSAATPGWQRQPDPTPAWQQQSPVTPSWQQRPDTTPSWKQSEPTPSWQQPDATPSWQQPDPVASWQQSSATTPSWQQPDVSEPPPSQGRRQPAPRPPAESSPSWQQPADPTPAWTASETPSWSRGAIEGTATWSDPAGRPGAPRRHTEPPAETSSWKQAETRGEPETPSWQRTEPETPSRQRREPEAPGWQRAEAPSWQRREPETTGWQHTEPETGGWRRAEPETDGWRRTEPETASRQRTEPETPSWQRTEPETPSWQRAEPETPSWRRTEPETPSWRRTEPETPSWQRAEAPSWRTRRDDGRHLVREDDRAAWRREVGDPAESSPRVGRRRAPEGGTGWTTRSDADDWAGYTDTGGLPVYPDRATPRAPSWDGARHDSPTAYGQPAGRRALPAAPYDDAGYDAAPYETGRRSRTDGVTGAPALPAGRAGHMSRGRRYAEEPHVEEPAGRRYTPDEPPTGRRAARYADEEQDRGYPSAARYADEEQDRGYPAAAMPVETRPEDTRAGRRRAAEADYDRHGPAAAQFPARTGREPSDWHGAAADAPPSRGRAGYNPGRGDWREQTGTWEAEPDTSSWTRDPDTGQWSRAEDDPRVLAWRREAARRDEAERGGGQRALPAAPSSWDRGDDRPDGGPARHGDPTGAPYDGPTGTARGGTRYGDSYGGPPDPAPSSGPRGATAYSGGTYGGAPRHDERPPYADEERPPRGGTYGTAQAGSPSRYTGSASAGSVPYGDVPGSTVVPYDPADDPYRRGAEQPPAEARRRELEPRGAEQPPAAEAWRREPEPPRGVPDDDAAPHWSTRGEPAGDQRQRMAPGEWQRREREERARGSASYRDVGGADWRRDLADSSDLAEGESRRYGTSDYIPFRSSGAASVPGSSNLSMTSTSLISPVREREAAAPPERAGNGFTGMTGSYERRAMTGGYPMVRRGDLLDPDEEDDQESGGPLAAVGYTVVWYGVPIVLFILYMLMVNAGGSSAQALNTLAKAAPQFGISLVLSIVVAVGLRFISHSWKAISVGLAAAVVGGGLATVLTSAITGTSLS